jgi:hypothetical protein
MTTAGWIAWGFVVILILIPPKYDPAIRLREWIKRKRKL